MNRRKFLSISASSVIIAGVGGYLLSDKSNFIRGNIPGSKVQFSFSRDEREILYLASLAPSGHNTQPWFIKYIAPYHWILCNEKSKWLPGVDPAQRETILSIGAFMQNLEYAAGNLGYTSGVNILATSNQDEQVAEIKLSKTEARPFAIEQIKLRRTVRSNYLSDPFKAEDISYLIRDDSDFLYFIPNSTKEHRWLNEQTIEANRIQAYRDTAQGELANWIRFSGRDAAEHCDGLTTASMEIEGIPAWVLRNFYGKSDVMKKGFREQSIDKVKEQVSKSAGWMLITSKDNSVVSLLATGKRLQRLLLKIRKRNIAVHPMTQVLEEAAIYNTVNQATGINDTIQFVLRTGYVENYPNPVSIRRPVDWFVHS